MQAHTHHPHTVCVLLDSRVRCPRQIDGNCRVDKSRGHVASRLTTYNPLSFRAARWCHPSNTILSDYADPAVYRSQNFERCSLGLTAAYGPLGAKERP